MEYLFACYEPMARSNSADPRQGIDALRGHIGRPPHGRASPDSNLGVLGGFLSLSTGSACRQPVIHGRETQLVFDTLQERARFNDVVCDDPIVVLHLRSALRDALTNLPAALGSL